MDIQAQVTKTYVETICRYVNEVRSSGFRYLLRRHQAVRKLVARNEVEVAKIKWGNLLPKVGKGKKRQREGAEK
jgi:hypothetical protein